MPYITQEQRDLLYIDPPENPGELNYCISTVIRDYWKYGSKTYQTINDILGALEGAKLEFVRRIVNPYEQKKCDENGDIY